MEIETTRFGTITVEEDTLIHMPHGMLGFPDKRRFVILKHREGSPFYWFQSVDDSALAFVITSPFLFKPDYEVDVEKTLEDMSWDKEDNGNLELYVAVNIPKDSPKETTANLIGPILVNNKTRQAVQMVVGDSSYSHRYPLIRGA